MLGREDPLEKEMATHSSTLGWRIPWREGRKESDTTERLHSLSIQKTFELGKEHSQVVTRENHFRYHSNAMGELSSGRESQSAKHRLGGWCTVRTLI